MTIIKSYAAKEAGAICRCGNTMPASYSRKMSKLKWNTAGSAIQTCR